MPIEFRCATCEKLLRVPDDSAGRQAKCPNCAAVLTVPEASPTADQQGPFAPLPSQGSAAGDDNPFGMAPPMDRPDEVNPYASPTAYVDGLDAIPAGTQSEIVPAIIDIGDVMSRAWEINKANVWICALVAFVCWILPQVVSFAFAIPAGIAQAAGSVEVYILLQVLNWLTTLLFQTWIGVGQAMYFIQTCRGNDPSFAVIFQGAPYYLRVLGYTILMFFLILGIIAVMCGVPFLITWAATGDPGTGAIVGLIAILPASLPVAYVLLVFSQTGNLIIDQNMGLFDSLGVSKTVMTGNKLSVFVLWLIAIPLTLAGCLAFFVGLFFAMAYVFSFYAVAYLVMTGQRTLYDPGTRK